MCSLTLYARSLPSIGLRIRMTRTCRTIWRVGLLIVASRSLLQVRFLLHKLGWHSSSNGPLICTKHTSHASGEGGIQVSICLFVEGFSSQKYPVVNQATSSNEVAELGTSLDACFAREINTNERNLSRILSPCTNLCMMDAHRFR